MLGITWSRRTTEAVAAIVLMTASVIVGTADIVHKSVVPTASAASASQDVDRFLLDATLVSATLGGIQLKESSRANRLSAPPSESTIPKECETVDIIDNAAVYADAGWTSAATRGFTEVGDGSQSVYEMIVAMPSPERARQFLHDSNASWLKCSGKNYADMSGDKETLWTVQDVHQNGDMVIASSKYATSEWFCEHAMGARSRYVTEVRVCGPTKDGKAQDVADQILQKANATPPPEVNASHAHQTDLPFTGLGYLSGLAVDGAGTAYVADGFANSLLALAPDSNSQRVLPFTGLTCRCGVAVDSAGTVYVTDNANHRVLALPAGAAAPNQLPFNDIGYADDVAVDRDGAVYVVDSVNKRVVMLTSGATSQVVLPFTELQNPVGVAVDSRGTVYVADTAGKRVVALPAGSTTQAVLPIPALDAPTDVAVDSEDAVYIADPDAVWKLPAGSASPTKVPFTGIPPTFQVAVDKAGAVYVTTTDRVVKLSPG